MLETIRRKVNNHEKKLIYDYYRLGRRKDVESQLLNKRRKTIDVAIEEVNDIIGALSMECNHCNNRKLMFKLDELSERLESELSYYSSYEDGAGKR